MDFFIQNTWIIAALPIWIFLIIIFGQSSNVYKDKKITTIITVLSTLIGLIFSSFILAKTIIVPDYVYQYNFEWLRAGNITLSLGFLVDNVTALMLMVVTSISLFIQIYSHEYMNNDKDFHRFFAYLNFFNFSMLGLVISSNLFQTYIFWELLGLSSYLLIGFWYKRPSAANAAKKAFIMNRIGDFGLLVGIMAFLNYSLSWWLTQSDTMLAFTSLASASSHVLNYSGPLVFGLIAFAMLLGPIAKSAQFPLHTWLPDAMEGPTPISALIHAATMVAAGVFLIARLYPIFVLSPYVMTIMAVIGGLTAFIAATIAIVQLDIKKSLAYSTCSQLGYMVMAMGVGAYGAGMFHLTTHAYFKALLFLCAGAVIHGLANQQDMRFMGGLRKHMPCIANCYLVGTLAISGLFLSGYYSKEEIFSGLLSSGEIMLLVIGILIAGMTSFYSFRAYFMTFEGEYRGNVHPHNPSRVTTIPLIALAIPAAILGFVLSGTFVEFITGEYIHHSSHNIWLPIISITVALVGFILAAAMYWDVFRNKVFKLEASDFKKQAGVVYTLCSEKWYCDKINDAFVDKVMLGIARFMNVFDKYVVDGTVNLIAKLAQLNASILRLFQNGNVQTYVTFLFSGTVFISLLVVVYFLIKAYI